MGRRSQIYRCGFHATNVHSFIKESEFVKEVEDEIERLNGRQTAADRCYTAYENYNANPSESTRAALKVAYEAVPEHTRQFVLGDMDVKDIPIRMIIYGDAELESWTHRNEWHWIVVIDAQPDVILDICP